MKRKNIKDNRGFTLTEMLVTLLILGFVTLCVVSGIAASIRCYQDLMFQSESRLLISSLNESIKDTLRYASNVSLEENTLKADGYEKVKNFSFYKEKYSKNNQLSKYDSTEGSISVSDTGYLTLNTPVNSSVLGGEGIYSQSLYIRNFTLEYHEEYNMFRFSYIVCDKRNNSHGTDSEEVYVRSWIKK